MPAVPTKKVSTITRHEWVIGDDLDQLTAKDFHFGIHHAEQEMDALGVDLGYDDAYQVRAGDDNQVILFVDITSEE